MDTYKDAVYRVKEDELSGQYVLIKYLGNLVHCDECIYAEKTGGKIKCTFVYPPLMKRPDGFCDEGVSNIIPFKKDESDEE